MALNAGAVYLDVVPDTSGFATSLNRQMDGVASKLSATSSKLRSVGTKMSQAITLPLVAVGGLSLKAASDLNEAMTATNATFGKSAKTIQKWSKTAATSMGLSRTEALEGARGFGAMLDTAGVATDALAPMSKRMVQLAADMGSFNNQDPSEMLERLRSGLAGEAEPLRRFGVFLSEAAMQSYAVKNGIAAQGEELTEAQKVQARYGLILEQTTKQQGDFERTSGGVANQTRIVKAQFTDTAAALGTALLPIAQKAAELLRGLLDRFNGLSDSTKKWILIIGGVAAVAGPVIGAIGAIGGALAFLAANPIVLIVAGIVALGAALVLAYKKSETFRNIVNAAFGAIADFAQKVWPQIQAVIQVAMDAIKAIIAKVTDIAKAIWNRWGDNITQIAKTVWRLIQNVIRSALQIIKGVIDVVTGIIKGDWSRVWDGIKGILSGVWNLMKSIVRAALGIVAELIKSGWDAVRALFRTAWERIKDIISGAWNFIKTAVREGKDWLIDLFKRLPGLIVKAIGNLGKLLYEKGKSLISGFVKGIKDESHGIGDVIGDAIKRGVGAVTHLPLGGGIGTGTPGGSSLTAIGRWLQASGFRVAGHPAFPPIGGHTKGSYHYIGRAIDVNWGPGGGSPQEFVALQGVAAKIGSLFSGRILESLGPWNDAAHGGSNMHWHLAMDRGGLVRGPATVHIGNIKEDVAFIPRTGPGAGQLGPTINIYGDIYGFDDFRSKVAQALNAEVRRFG